MRTVFEWNLGNRSILLGKRTLLMGVVNVTPDSFSDGGQHFSRESALQHALQLVEDGADILDIGGESTRPGAKVGNGSFSVSEQEELDRILPVIKDLKKQRPDVLLSVDTYKSGVARAAVEAGADIVNDVSGFQWDPMMVKTLAGLKCGAILMHMRGRPDEWKTMPAITQDVVVLVKRELRDRADAAVMAGLKRERIVLDPGFGFGKRMEENFPLLKRFQEFHQLRYPFVVGVSRKSFVGRAVARNGKDAPIADRLYGTLSAETALVLLGAHILRTHDVRATADAVRVADIVMS
jgi:dihydropteroate synthase